MPNWKIHNGDFYVAKSGSVAAGVTGDADNPFRSLQQAFDAASQLQKTPVIIVIGAGNYAEDLLYSGDANLSLNADGKVLLGPHSRGGTLINHRGNQFTIGLNGLDIVAARSLVAGSKVQVHLSECSVKDSQIGFSDRGSSFNRTIFRNSELKPIARSDGYYRIGKCSFIQSTVAGLGLSTEGLCSIMDCWFDETSRIESSNSSRIGNFDTNNFQFSAGRGLSGFEIEIDGQTHVSLASLQNAFPRWNRYSIHADPQFNSAAFEDLTLNPSSPMAHKGSDGFHIGAWDIGYAYGASSSELDPRSVLLNGVEYSNGSYRLMTGVSEGTIETRAIDLQSRQTLGKIRLFATQNYPTDVVDSSNRSDVPNRQTFEMKFGDDPRTFGSYLAFEWDQAPTYNPAGTGGFRSPLGNGEPSFDVRAAVPVVARYVQLKVTLRNNGIEA